MSATNPTCGHQSLISNCQACERFKRQWYQKLQASDPDFHDIEYGLENPERLYEPVDVDRVDPLTTDYYDRVLEIWHRWQSQGRRKRDCVIAELLGFQNGTSGTERGISDELKRRGLRPFSRFTVRQTIEEIDGLVMKIAQPHRNVEQAESRIATALYLLDSKPSKDEANGETETSVSSDSNAAAA